MKLCLALALALAGLGWSAVAAPALGNADGAFHDCSDAPKGAVLSVPAPFDRFMRIQCARAGATLGPMPGFHWVFPSGISMALSALSVHSSVTGRDAYFTRVEAAPLSAAEDAAFRKRVAPIVRSPSMLEGDFARLEVDTSTGDHKQVYLFVSHAPSGAVSGAWGIECFHDCDPMDASPWAFIIVPDEAPRPARPQ